MVVPDLTDVGPEYALIILIGWVAWEVYAPKVLGTETALSPLIELPKRVEAVEKHTSHLQEKLEALDEKQVHHIQVTRANARALDEERNVTIDSENVDEYLVDNSIPIAVLTRRGDGNDGM